MKFSFYFFSLLISSLLLSVSQAEAASLRASEPSTVLAVVGVSALVLAILGSTYTYTKYKKLENLANSLTNEELEILRAEIAAKKAEIEALENNLKTERKSIKSQIEMIEKQKKDLEIQFEKNRADLELKAKQEEERLSDLIKTRMEAEEKRVRDMAEESHTRFSNIERQLREKLLREDQERIDEFNRKVEALKAQSQLLAKQQEELAQQRSLINAENNNSKPHEDNDQEVTPLSNEATEQASPEEIEAEKVFVSLNQTNNIVRSSVEQDLDQLLYKDREEKAASRPIVDTSIPLPDIKVESIRPQTARDLASNTSDSVRERSHSVGINPTVEPASSVLVKSSVKFVEGINSPLTSHKRNKSQGDFSKIPEYESAGTQPKPMDSSERKRGGSHIVRKTSTNSLFSEVAITCSKCQRSIFGSPITTPSGSNFHPRCFICLTCRKPIKGKYFPSPNEEGEEEFNCEDCYERENLQKPNFLIKRK